MRIENSKLSTVRALQSIGYDTIASGDSFNDLAMIQASKAGLPLPHDRADPAGLPQYPAYDDYASLLGAIRAALAAD
jgi:phosphoserine/homoserine phosphotransferase